MVTYWEMAELLALLYVMFSCVYVTFPYGVMGRAWYAIVWIPDICIFLYVSKKVDEGSVQKLEFYL